MDYEERQGLRKRNVNFTVYLPVTLVEVVDRVADSEQRSPGEVFIRVLRKGLAAERDERAAKQV